MGGGATAPAEVLRLGLEIGRASGGAFDIGVGDAVTAWGFGPEAARSRRASAPRWLRRAARARGRWRSTDPHVRKRAPIALDLNGIAKGYGVDRLAETLRGYGIEAALVGIDGEMRALGLRPDGEAWTIAVEAPDAERRDAPFHPRAAGRRRRDFGRLPPLGRGEGHGACRTPWTRPAARRCSHRPHRSRSSLRPVPRRMPGRPR